MKSGLTFASISYWAIFIILSAGAILSGSSSVLSEAMHQLFDAITVTFALFSTLMASRPASGKLSFGYHRLENLSVLMNAAALAGGAAFSFYVATQKLLLKGSVDTGSATVLSIAALPLLLATALFLNRGEHGMTEKGVFLHTLSDTATLVIVILTLIVMFYYNSAIIDSISAYIITGIFIYTSTPLLKDGIKILLDSSPENIHSIEMDLMGYSSGVHHVHVWTMCSHIRVATIHVTEASDRRLADLEKERRGLENILAKHGINHSTIQFESANRLENSARD